MPLPLNYHKEILAKYGLKVPTDKASYYAVMDALKAKGIENPMQLHGSMSDDFFNILSLQYATRDGVKPIDLAKGTVPFNSKTIVDALKLFKELYDKGYLARNFWSVGGTDGRMGYAQGKYALKMGFFWDVYTHKDMGMPYENQGVAPFPNLAGVKNPYRVAARLRLLRHQDHEIPQGEREIRPLPDRGTRPEPVRQQVLRRRPRHADGQPQGRVPERLYQGLRR